MNTNQKNRRGLISWQRHQLLMPRFQMSLLLLLTGLIGFFSSFLLLHFGVSRMWLRYPLAILAAYAAFLVLLRLWLTFRHSQDNLDFDVHLDLTVDGSSSGSVPSNADFVSGGGGGDFGGGGAGGSWGESAASSSPSSGGGSVWDVTGFDFDLDEIGFVVVVIVALLGGLFALLYVVYIAPAFLAEILVDGLLVGGLYKRVGQIEHQHWLQTAARKTLLPAVLCALFFGVAGGALQTLAPEANSIGEVWSVLKTRKQ